MFAIDKTRNQIVNEDRSSDVPSPIFIGFFSGGSSNSDPNIGFSSGVVSISVSTMFPPSSRDWAGRIEEQQVRLAIDALNHAESGDKALDAERRFKLANKTYSLYILQNSPEKAELLRMLFSNCSVDALSATPVYRKTFDMIFKRVEKKEWSGRRDSNPRPSGPKPDALPGCATPRLTLGYRSCDEFL